MRAYVNPEGLLANDLRAPVQRLSSRQVGLKTKDPHVVVMLHPTSTEGRLLQETIVEGRTYLSVRWKGWGVSVYLVTEASPGMFGRCFDVLLVGGVTP